MKRLFSRRPATAALPELASESWDSEGHVVIVHLVHDTLRPEDHESADRLTTGIVAVVTAIQAGVVAESIPEGTQNAGVRLQIEPSDRHLGPLEERTVEIFSERLGTSIPITVTDGANPPDVEDDPEEDPKIADPVFSWDPSEAALSTTVKLPLTSPQTRTARVARAALDAALTGIAKPGNRDLIPGDLAGSARYSVSIVIHPRSDLGPATAAIIDRATERLSGTRVDLAWK